MKKQDTIRVHDQEAALYDQQVVEYNCYVHDALFGMCFEYIDRQGCLLDIGIGTGLASHSFAKLGVKVYGCDGSPEMLKECEAKGFAKDLKVFDFRNLPLPYPDSRFDHVICCGVLHFFDNLEPILAEVVRVIKPGAIFAFTAAGLSNDEKTAAPDNAEHYFECDTPWGVSIFKHRDEHISHLLQASGFNILKSQKLLIRGGPENGTEDMLFKIYVAKN